MSDMIDNKESFKTLWTLRLNFAVKRQQSAIFKSLNYEIFKLKEL
jgi:ribosomal protein L20